MPEAKELFCMSCMHPVPAGARCCPNCGYDGTQQNPEGLLPIGTRLDKGGYIVGRVTKVSPYSADYVGYDVKRLRSCSVREFLPAGGAVRRSGETRLQPVKGATDKYKRGLASFLGTYQRLADVEPGSALPGEFGCFMENGTAYCVTELFDGMTLKELLKRNGGTLTPAQTQMVLQPVMKALEILHSNGLVHGGICPDNILINTNGDVRITGLSADEDAGSQGLVGYVAPEAYSGQNLGAEADVYSLAAVFYRCVTGSVPQDSDQRRSMDNLSAPGEDEGVNAELSAALTSALMMGPALRTRSVEEFAARAEQALAEPAPEEEKEPEPPAEEKARQKRKNRWLFITVICASVFLIALGIFIASRHMKQPADDPVARTVRVPDYVGQKIYELEFDTVNFSYVIINTYNDGDINVVTGQDPPRGSSVAVAGSSITLYVNREKEKTFTVGNYAGKSGLEVAAALDREGMNYTIVYQPCDDYPAGTILAQSLEPGTEMTLYDTLVLAVAEEWNQ